MAEGRLDRALAAPMEQFTPHTFTDPDALRADLAAIRARGYAIDGEEKNLGMRCIATPVFDVNQEAVAGISVSGPISRVGPDDVVALADHVITAAQQLTLAIGGEA